MSSASMSHIESLISAASLKKRRTITNSSAILDDRVPPSMQGKQKAKGKNVCYEEQLILRFPKSLASELRKSIKSGSLREDLRIEFKSTPYITRSSQYSLPFACHHHSDNVLGDREAIVTFKGATFAAMLVDLPCIIESFMTTNKKQYYKIADVCQVKHPFTAIRCLLSLVSLALSSYLFANRCWLSAKMTKWQKRGRSRRSGPTE